MQSSILNMTGFSLLAVLIVATNATAETESEPSETWSTLFEVSGDLNKDGKDDLVQVLEHKSDNQPPVTCKGEEIDTDAPARRLLISLSQENGRLKPVMDSPSIIFRKDEGGVFGDPLEHVSIEKGALLIEFYGGSRWRWGRKLRLRYDEGDWNLIGYSEFAHDSYGGSGTYYDYNPLTHKLKVFVEIDQHPDGRISPAACIRCRIGESCPEKDHCYEGTKTVPPGDHWFDLPKRPLVRLEEYRCWQSETGFFKHIGLTNGE